MNKQFSMVNSTKLLILMLCIVSYGTTSAQDSTDQKRYAILVDLAQPTIGQVQVGVLLPILDNMELFVFGRYNYNYVPNSLGYNYNDADASYRTYEYREGDAVESGFTIGGQVRRMIKPASEKLGYYQYLKKNTRKFKGYYGAWLEFGNSQSIMKKNGYFYYDIEGNVPNPSLEWTNVSGGLLSGIKSDISNSIVIDLHVGLGYRYSDARYEEPGLEQDTQSNSYSFNGLIQSTQRTDVAKTNRIGVQIGYKF